MPGRSSKVPTKRASKSAALHRVFGQPSHRRSNLVRAGLYARVSTHDQQTLPLQRRALREYVDRRGWTIGIDIQEVGSGASVRELRQKVIHAARRRDIALLAVFAEFEREILQERVRAGLAHARENGKRLGRPPTASLNAKQIRRLFRAGVSKAAIARNLQIGRTSVRRILSSAVG